MSRPQRCRRIALLPPVAFFKPAGLPGRSLPETVVMVDEFEALRLADYEGLYQEQAAERMGVSRQTFGRIIETARKKVARALVEGMALRIEGGKVEIAEMQTFECECGRVWGVPVEAGRPVECPECQSQSFQPVQETGVGQAGGGRGRCCRHRRAGQGRGRGGGMRQRRRDGAGPPGEETA